MGFRPHQWWPVCVANAVATVKAFYPAFKQWMFYGFRRALLIIVAKYAIDVFWLCFKKRKLGVTYARELSLKFWVPPSYQYEWKPEMRVFIRRCGHHYSRDGNAIGTQIEPWFYGEMRNDTKVVLEQIEAKALKRGERHRFTQSEDVMAIERVVSNFKDFSMDEIMTFFKASELVNMEEGQLIFGEEDSEQYFYGVVSGEIHLFCEGFGNSGLELLKVAGSDECIVSLSAFLHYFAVGPQTFGELKLHAKCGQSGTYYRVPILELIRYVREDKRKMNEICKTILIRQQKFVLGLNDLTGIAPRLHTQSYLDPNYTPIDVEPGVLELDSPLAHQAFEGLQTLFQLPLEDRRLCWVGVLDSRTMLLRRFKPAKYVFYLHDGMVACTVSKLRRSYNAVQFYLKGGEMIGWREAVVGLDMDIQFQVADGAKAIVVAIPDFVVRSHFEQNPEICVPLIAKLFNRYGLPARQICYALRYTHKRANEVIYKKNEEGVGELYAYLCLSGRLRFLLDTEETKSGPSVRYGIIEKGDWFGMVAMYTDSPQVHRTVVCDRYCDLGIMPRYVISVITSAFREAAGYQVDYMARCIHRDYENTPLDTDKMHDSRFQVDSFGLHTWRSYRMVCVYPSSSEIPAKIYCDELARHHTCKANVVTKQDAMNSLKVSEFTPENEYALAKWLVCEEEKCTVMFIIADSDFNDLWNETIARICDMVQVLVTLHQDNHKPDEDELRFSGMATKARKELIFIHPVTRVTKPQVGPTRFPHLPVGSILWLRLDNLTSRPWIQRHFHVRMLDSAFRYMKEKNPEDLKKYLRGTKHPDKHSDFARVVRWITGQSVGLVLGGGGAKGAAHIGVLKYLNELDIPLDYIGGVSIGSFIGAIYAIYENFQVVEYKAKELWKELKNPFRYFRDLALPPLTPAFRGSGFNGFIMYSFGNIQMEDLYIPFFCVSTDLNASCARTHMSGDLWFYVRASMTISEVLPAQINQFDNHLLMDGGYSDLVPAMAMRKLGIKYLIAINIGDDRLVNTFNIGYHVSGLHCLFQNLLPYSTKGIPRRDDYWEAVLSCSARNFIQILKAMDEYCIYIRPAINGYNSMDFKSYEEIKTLGYNSTKFKFGSLKVQNLPVHVIWYLLRFYTYPAIAPSQSQLLAGFSDEDWAFAVNLMSKTQMFQRASNTFLEMNLTPYLTDLMEARSYLTNIINQKEITSINLHVPVLENFFRDDERLDLVHAIARMKEWTYMEDFETIVKETSVDKEVNLRAKTNLKIAASTTLDLKNARAKTHMTTEAEVNDDLVMWTARQSFSIKDLFKADPTLFRAGGSFMHLQMGKEKSNSNDNEDDEEGFERYSEAAFIHKKVHTDTTNTVSSSSALSLHSIAARFAKAKAANVKDAGKPAKLGQTLTDFRKRASKADGSKDSMPPRKLVPIMTLKQLRRSYESQGLTQL